MYFQKKSTLKDRKKSATDSKGRSRRDSSDEDRENRPSSASSSKHHNKKVSDKLKDHEKRREKRLENKKKEEQKKRDEERAEEKTKPVLSTQSSSNSTLDQKHKKTLSSIYSAIYSASSEDDEEGVVKSSGSESKPRSKILKKKPARSKAKGSEVSSDVSSSVEDSSSENDSADEEDEEEAQMSVASSASSKSVANSSSTTVSSSSSSSSPSESSSSSSSGSDEVEEEEEEEVKPAPKSKAKPKRKASALVEDMEMDDTSVHPPPTISSPVEATSQKPQMTSSETESDIENHVEESTKPEAELIANDDDSKKKPVPLRRASALTETTQIPEESPPHIMDHCYAKPHSASKEYEEEKTSDKECSQFESHFAMDHGYTRPRTPPGQSPTKTAIKAAKPEILPAKPAAVPKLPGPAKARTTSNSSSAAPVPQIRARTFKTRDPKEQYEIIYRFLTKGLDLEDIGYLKRSYETMLRDQDKKPNVWVNDTHWVDHTITDIPSPVKKRRKDDFSRPHHTGSCRTEGYYKMDPREKLRTKYHLHRSEGDAFTLQGTKIANFEGSVTKGKLQTAQNLSREARSNQRRQLAILGDEAATSDLLKFNQLKVGVPQRRTSTFEARI